MNSWKIDWLASELSRIDATFKENFEEGFDEVWFRNETHHIFKLALITKEMR